LNTAVASDAEIWGSTNLPVSSLAYY
jgi:hypothetical protein